MLRKFLEDWPLKNHQLIQNISKIIQMTAQIKVYTLPNIVKSHYYESLVMISIMYIRACLNELTKLASMLAHHYV